MATILSRPQSVKKCWFSNQIISAGSSVRNWQPQIHWIQVTTKSFLYFNHYWLMLSLAKCSLLSHGIWSLDKNGQHFADGIFKYPSSKKNSSNFIQVSWKFISWCQSGEISQLSVGRWWPGANYVTSWKPNSYSPTPHHPSPLSAAYMCLLIGSALAQVVACRLTAPSHYLNQCWLIVNWTLRNKLQ